MSAPDERESTARVGGISEFAHQNGFFDFRFTTASALRTLQKPRYE